MLAAPSYAQSDAADSDGDDQIVVFATKRAQNLQDVPASIQAIDAATLQDIGATSFTDVFDRFGGLGGTITGDGTTNLNVRGLVGLGRAFFSNPTVGFYIDETPISSGVLPVAAMVDLEQVEILRGPQGTLYGEGSLGGTIRLATRKPQIGEFEGRIAGDIGVIDSQAFDYNVNGVLNAPIGQQTAVRVSASYEDREGYIDNIVTGLNDINFSQTTALRASVLHNFADNFEVIGSYSYQDRDFGDKNRIGLTTPDLTIDIGNPQGGTDRSHLGNITVNWSLDWFDVVSSTSYYDRERTLFFSNDALVPLVESAVGPIIPNGVVGDSVVTEEFIVHESRLVSNTDGPLSWIAGFFYREQERDLYDENVAPDLVDLLGPLATLNLENTVQDTRDIAGFGELTYAITDTVRLTGGLRYFDQKIDAVSNSSVVQASLPPSIATVTEETSNSQDDGVLYKASVDWNITDDVLVYALTSRGVRGGGVNTSRFVPDVIPIGFASDTATNYEIGIKSQWYDQRLTFNASLYRLDYEDVQLTVEPIPGVDFLTNAGEAESLGAEIETLFSPTDNIRFGGSFSYIDATFSEDVIVFEGDTSTPDDDIFVVEGSELPQVAEIAFNIFGDFSYPTGNGYDVFGRADYVYRGDRNNSVTRSNSSTGPRIIEAYGELDLSLGFENDVWSLSLFATNVTDKRGQLVASGAAVRGIEVLQPRTIGFRASANF